MVSARRTVSIIAGAWCGASAFGLSILYNNNFKEEVGCHSQTTISRSYAWIRLALFVSTSLISGFCHLSIQLTALRHMRQIDVAKQVAKRMRSLRGTTASSLRLIKTFFIMYLLLLVCWLPGLIAFSLGVQGALMNVVVILAELNAVLNILVYILGNRQFRCAVADLLAQRPPTEMSI
ncbi:hypothetical protein RRG08_042692 [Elysia crispata]|uniref:G-protein coupled receptors family 1 profile domain-containing protein n=1 Tax=Elysia crispata TaxID=231223 RepID=A0AAE0XQ49_9GAST|nr:hypothetical protein RRG08_042692 [Elysia crispata]